MTAARIRHQSGAVLILVLWITALLALLLGAFSLTLRVEQSVGSEQVQQVRARAAGDAVLNYLAAVRRVDEDAWAGMVGEVVALPWRDSNVQFRFIPEASFVSLNFASPSLLVAVFEGLGVDDPVEWASAVVSRRGREQSDHGGSTTLPWVAVEELLTLGEGLEQLDAPERLFSADSTESRVVLDYAAPPLQAMLAGRTGVIEGYTPLPHEPELFRVQVMFGQDSAVRQAEFTVVFEEDGAGYRLARSHLFAARFEWDGEHAAGHQ